MSLIIEDLYFRYARARDYVLEGISLEARPGELIGLLGPNGTGKSTLLKCIQRVLPCEKGKVTILGEDARKLDTRRLAQLLSYVPQSTHMSFPVTVVDTVSMGRIPFMQVKMTAEDKDKVFAALELLDLAPMAFRHVNELSGGERQRVLIARSLAQEPQALLLDEATSSLDLRNQLNVMETICDVVRSQQIMAITAIHDINLASMFCDRIVMLQRGRVSSFGTPGKVITSENLRAVYGVDADIIASEGVPHAILRCASRCNRSPRISGAESELCLERT